MKKVRLIIQVVSLAACAAAPFTPFLGHAAVKPAQSIRPASTYVLGADDVIEIIVRNHDDLRQVITIRPDGKIAMPRVAGEIQAAGKTPTALAATIQKELSKSLNHVRVTVAVKEVHSQRARVVGTAIKSAGIYELKPNWRLMDLVAAGGGLSTKVVRVSGRIVRGRTNVIPLDMQQAFNNPNSSANVLLKTGDLVMLDALDISKQIHVGGAVNKPGPFDLEESLTPVSLLAEAGGAKGEAALSRAYVQRGSLRLPLNLRPTLDGGVANTSALAFKFRAGDVLVVPENQLRFGVQGKVARPNYYPYPEDRQSTSVLKTLALAGNALPDGDLRKAEIRRITDGKPVTIPINLDAISKGEAEDVMLLADDVLFIPERHNQVIVSGQVGKPGAYEIKEGMTLISLVAEAGNWTTGAGLSAAYILRGRTQIPVNLYTAMIQGRPDEQVLGFELQNNDLLMIPNITNQLNVIGQVNKAGTFNLDDNLTVASLLTQAGGATGDAALGKAYVLRNDKQIPLNLLATAGGIMSPAMLNFRFEPGDALVVPTIQARYAVMGQVRDPGSFAYPEQKGSATVIQALTRAGGQLADANLKGASILHTATNQSEPVNIDDMLKKGGTPIILQPGDVLYIPQRNAPGKSPLSLLGPLSMLFRLF